MAERDGSDSDEQETRVVPAGDPTSVGHPQYPEQPQYPGRPQYPGQPYPGPLHSGQQTAGQQTAGQQTAGQQTETWPPPPPPPPPVRPEHTRRWIAALSAVIVLVAGLLGAGVWLVTHSLGPSVPEGFRAVDTPYLSYAVPADWAAVEGEGARVLGVTFTGGADGPPYTCRGDGYRRGLVTSTLVSGDADPATTAAQFANQLGRSFYTDTAGHVPQVELSEPRATTAGTVVEATVTTPVDDGCLATGGVVAVLAAPVDDGAGGTAILVANVDTVGGPADSPLPDPAIVTEVMDSAG